MADITNKSSEVSRLEALLQESERLKAEAKKLDERAEEIRKAIRRWAKEAKS
jgi:hypothetical protein